MTIGTIWMDLEVEIMAIYPCEFPDFNDGAVIMGKNFLFLFFFFWKNRKFKYGG